MLVIVLGMIIPIALVSMISIETGMVIVIAYHVMLKNVDRMEVIGGDDMCDGFPYNTQECGLDGSDCIDYNELYPHCTGICYIVWICDDMCDGFPYNTEECGWDESDCVELNLNYPNCTAIQYSDWVGNGWCNDTPYNTEECGWAGDDCFDIYSNTITSIPSAFFGTIKLNTSDTISNHQRILNTGAITKILRYSITSILTTFFFIESRTITHTNSNYSDCVVDNTFQMSCGVCDYTPYNIQEYGWDEGDCILKDYPNCTGIGNSLRVCDGMCDGLPHYTEECR